MKDKELVVKKDGILNKVFAFFYNIFSKSSNVSVTENIEVVSKDISKNENISKPKEEIGLSRLLEIQNQLKRSGINEENLTKLISDLNFEEREKLKALYKQQNISLKSEIDVYSKKIQALKI